jgi:hypothetical protein
MNQASVSIQDSEDSDGEDDDDDDESDVGLPRALLTDREYESLICGACVGQHMLREVLKSYACEKGVLFVVRKRQRTNVVRYEEDEDEEEGGGELEVGAWESWGEWKVLGTPVEVQEDGEDKDEDEGEEGAENTEDGRDMDVNSSIDTTTGSRTTRESSNISPSAVVGVKRRRTSDAQSSDSSTGRSTKRARSDARIAATSTWNIEDSPYPAIADPSPICTKPSTRSSSTTLAPLSWVKAIPEYAPSSSLWEATARPAAPAVSPATTTWSMYAGIISNTGDIERVDDYEEEVEEESLCDVFLSAGFRERWCRCAHVSSSSLFSVSTFSALPTTTVHCFYCD